jgi:hypothetical protein
VTIIATTPPTIASIIIIITQPPTLQKCVCPLSESLHLPCRAGGKKTHTHTHTHTHTLGARARVRARAHARARVRPIWWRHSFAVKMPLNIVEPLAVQRIPPYDFDIDLTAFRTAIERRGGIIPPGRMLGLFHAIKAFLRTYAASCLFDRTS